MSKQIVFRRLTVVPLFMVALAVFLLTDTLALSSIMDAPPAMPGFTHTPFAHGDTPEGHGAILVGTAVVRSSPVIADIDGNTENGLEVAVASNNGYLHVYGSTGTLLWVKQVSTCNDSLHASPTVGELLIGSGEPYVIMGYGPTSGGTGCDGGIAVYRGFDGAEVWRYSLKAISPSEAIPGVISTPAIADTDGDGVAEIAFGGLDRNVHLLNADSSIRMIYHAADTVWSSPAFYNIDNDNQLELIIGTDISANQRLNPPTSNGGYVYAFDTHTRNPVRVPFQEPGSYMWRTTFDQVIFSSPVIADVLASNPGNEIIIGAGCYFPAGSTNKLGRWVKILRPSDGAVLQTLNATACVQSSVAVGDIDDDNELEIVANVSGNTSIGGDGASRIIAWDPTSPTPKWAMTPTDPNSGSNDSYGGDLQSPIIADVDGNGSLEVISANFWSVHVLQGSTGTPLTCQNVQCGSQTALFSWYTLKSTPAIGDVNKDGKLDLFIGGGHAYSNGFGMLYGWTNFAGFIGSAPGQQEPYSAPWPMTRGNHYHTGVYGLDTRIIPSLTSISGSISPNHHAAYSLSFRNSIGTALEWAVTLNDAHSIVTLNRTTGTSNDALGITLSAPAGLSTGTYDASLDVAVAGLETVTIPIAVYVAQTLYDVYLPVIK